MQWLKRLVEQVTTGNFEEYSGDIVTALTPDKWRTKQELDADVAALRLARLNELGKVRKAEAKQQFPYLPIMSPQEFWDRYLLGVSSPIIIRKTLTRLVQEQFVMHHPRPLGPEAGQWEYGLNPTRRLAVSSGKRARTPNIGLVAVPARTS